MSLRNVQRQAASRFAELGTDLSSSLRPQRSRHRTSDLTTTARLLRNSRLFSLPPPLPPSASHAEGNTRPSNESQTATAPYPTRPAIITSPASLARGDWGLKRPLPSKAFQATTTPVIRVNANDTIDHITDFESAADHVFTLQKWQEMNLPVSVPRTQQYGASGRRSEGVGLSAFEESQDPKDIPAGLKDAKGEERGWGVDSTSNAAAARRWKFDSPWIAGMKAGEFEEYIRTTIKKRRPEFRDWLRTRLAEQRSHGTKQAGSAKAFSLDGGLDAELEKAAEKIVDEVTGEASMSSHSTDESVGTDILRLRSHQRELFDHVWAFLDLPGRLPGNQADSLMSYTDEMIDMDQGPPKTHPSAGLSYLHPTTWLHNHPMLGPMANAPPVEARVLQRSEGGKKPVVGVAGIAVESHNLSSEFAFQVRSIGHDGGPKLWVQPTEGQIDSRGRINLSVRKAVPEQPRMWGYVNGSSGAAREEELADEGGRFGHRRRGGNGYANAIMYGGSGARGQGTRGARAQARQQQQQQQQQMPNMTGVQAGSEEVKKMPETAPLSEQEVRQLKTQMPME